MIKGVIGFVAAVAVAFVVTLGATAQAEEGAYKAFYGWYAVGELTDKDGGAKNFTGTLHGTSFNTEGSGFAHLFSTVCPINNDISAEGVMNAGGTCTMTDAEGNTINLKWSCQGAPKCEGTFTFTGGTGKYSGISGENDFFAAFVTALEGYSSWDGQFKY